VGTVGRLDPVKDQAGLVRAFAALDHTNRDPRLVLVGDGPSRDELGGLTRDLGLQARVHLLGERRDISTVLASLDVFVLPSIAEGISNTVLEAMASALPVVATSVGGSPELIEDGVTGRLVPRMDPGALAAGIEGYLDDPHLRALHGKAARQRVVDHFSLDRMTQAYTTLYSGLLAGQKA